MPAHGDDDPRARDLERLAAQAAAFVTAYNGGDADALAGLFLPAGELVLSNGEVVSGRDGIAAFYREVLAGDERPQAALEAGAVRFIGPDIAIEDGTLHVTGPAGELVSHDYTALLVKQGDGQWLTASIRDDARDQAPAAGKLLALQWMIGDWLIEAGETRTFVTFDWSGDGPFIDGRAVTETAGAQSTAATYRIGWNAARRSFVSWSFDALGGYGRAEWTADGPGWLLRHSGVTADGEVSQATQSLVPDDSRETFTWSTRDQTIGGVVLPDRSVRVVKRPPPPVRVETP